MNTYDITLRHTEEMNQDPILKIESVFDEQTSGTILTLCTGETFLVGLEGLEGFADSIKNMAKTIRAEQNKNMPPPRRINNIAALTTAVQSAINDEATSRISAP